MSPEVYRLLVGDRGWRPERYEQWLKEILIDQLLPPPGAQQQAPPDVSAARVMTQGETETDQAGA